MQDSVEVKRTKNGLILTLAKGQALKQLRKKNKKPVLSKYIHPLLSKDHILISHANGGLINGMRKFSL